MKTVRFFHDFASPYSYFASTQIEALCAEHQAELIWSPMVLGAVFKAVEMNDVPIFAMSPAKRRHYQADMHRYADYYGVKLAWPSTFPLRTITPLRLALVAFEHDQQQGVALTHRIYRAAWAEGCDISKADALEALCEDVGCPKTWVEETKRPEIKQALFDATDRAVSAGVFGAPSFLLNEQELYWGQDRMPLLAHALSK